MPVTIKTGDLFADDAVAYVCPVNCVGVMGKGLALEFKQRYGRIHQEYRRWCGFTLAPEPGDVLTTRTLRQLTGPQYVLLAATKDHWRDTSLVEWVIDCLTNIEEQATQLNIPTVAMPALGCGNGDLPWAEIRHQCQWILKDSKIDYRVYEPHGETKGLGSV